MCIRDSFNNKPVEQHVREGQKEQYLAHARDVEKALRLEKVSRLGRKSADSFPVNLIAQIFNIPRTLPTFGKAFNK